MKHSIFVQQKNGMPKRSAFDTYGELEEIIDEEPRYEPYVLNREAESSESEDDQISREMAKYNKKLKEDSLKTSRQATAHTPTTNNYGRPAFGISHQPNQLSSSGGLSHRFQPVRSISPSEEEEEDKLPEVDKEYIAALNCAHFQQLFKGSPVPAGDIGYGRPPSAFLQNPVQSKAPAKLASSIFENVGPSKPEATTSTASHYGAPLNRNTYSEQFWFQSKKQMQSQLEKATRNVDKTRLSTESLALLDLSNELGLSKTEGSEQQPTFYDSIYTQNGKPEKQSKPNEAMDNKANTLQEIGDSSAGSKLLSELEPIFKASSSATSANANTQHEQQSLPTSSAGGVLSSRSRVLDALMAKAKPVSQVVDKKWQVNDDFHENIDWNGVTEVDWNVSKTDCPKPVDPAASPKKKGPEIDWDLEEESKKEAEPAENVEEVKQPQETSNKQEIHFFFDLNLDTTSSSDFERNQQPQSDNTQPRTYSSLTHMPMPGLLEPNSAVAAVSAASNERKAVEIASFVDLSVELKKCQEVESQTNGQPRLAATLNGGGQTAVVKHAAADGRDHQRVQHDKASPSEDTLDEKKQKILYLAAAISMATMAAPEGVLRLSKLVKIVDSVFGGHAKPELYGHKDWLSFINQHCRRNIQVIPKNRHEALLICNNSEDENSS